MSLVDRLKSHRTELANLHSDIDRIAAFLDGMATIAPDGLPTLNIRNYAILANQLTCEVEDLIAGTCDMVSEAEGGDGR